MNISSSLFLGRNISSIERPAEATDESNSKKFENIATLSASDNLISGEAGENNSVHALILNAIFFSLGIFIFSLLLFIGELFLISIMDSILIFTKTVEKCKNNNMKKLYLILLLLASNALAESTVGIGYYSIQNKTFPCDKALRVFDGVKKPALMFLWGTFGDDLSCVEKFVDLPQKNKEIYIHFSNECCRRNRTCKKGELLQDMPVWKLNNLLGKSDKKTKDAIKKRMKKILEFIENQNKKNPNIDWYISTGLEDNYTFAVKKKFFNLLKNEKAKSELKDKIKIYVNPLDGTCINPKCEIHKKDLGRNNHWLYIPDGYCVKPFDACKTNIFTIDELTAKLLAQKKNGNRFFLWWSEQQGRYGEPASLAKPPRKRTIRITDRQIKDANQILKKGN